jgi:hypothetical protein
LGIWYCKRGLVVSAVGGVALKLILAASFKVGLKVEVILTSFLPGVSCENAGNEQTAAKKIKMDGFMDKFNVCGLSFVPSSSSG